jgi:hypothetical protein
MLNNVLKWAACVLCCLGALGTSLQKLSILPDSTLNLVCLTASAVFYLIWSIRIRELNLIIVNAMVLVCWGIGLIPK